MFAGVALAATSVQDARDATGPIDIKSVTASSAGSGRWRFVIAFYGNVPSRGQKGNEEWNTRPHQLRGAPPGVFKETVYSVQMPQTGRRAITTGGHDRPVVTHGFAQVTRKRSTFTVVVPLKAIGAQRPAFYWKVVSQFYGPQSLCGTAFPDRCSDQAPDGAKVEKEAL
jgi:hypothetical protein